MTAPSAASHGKNKGKNSTGNSANQRANRQVIVVSNRVSLPDPATGKISAGGLAVGVKAALGSVGGGSWLGWSGDVIADDKTAQRKLDCLKARDITFWTIPLSQGEHNHYYEQMANEQFWPLMHELGDHSQRDGSAYKTYKAVNHVFADEIKKIAGPDDIIWVHDYHLFPLGQMLRQEGFKNPILFFNHIPIPSERFIQSPRVSPTLRSEFIENMTALFAYDKVGFQTTRDLRNYTEIMHQRGVNLPPHFNTVALRHNGRTTEFGAFPISIETKELAQTAKAHQKDEAVERLRKMVGDKKLVIGADRLDPTKGIPERVDGVARFLEKYPDQNGRFISLQVTPRSRAGIEAYEENRKKVHQKIMEVNAAFGNESYKPVDFTEKNIDRDALVAMYRSADVCMVTTLRDGMHLGAKEAIASQDPENPAAFIMSDQAGAYEELGGHGVLSINPKDPDSIADRMQEALNMPLSERKARYRDLMSVLEKNTVTRWAQESLKPFIRPGR